LEATKTISTKKEKKLGMLMLIFMITIIAAFLLRDSFGINIPTIIFIILYLLGFLILKRKNLLQFFIFLIPLSNGPLLYFLNVVFAILFLIKNMKYIRINRTILLSYVLILWEAFHLLPNSFLGYNESIIKLLGFALCLIVTSIVISNYELNNNYISIVFSWCIGLGSFCFILLLKYIYNYGLNNFSNIVRRFGWVPASLNPSSTSLLMNPNTLGKLVILTVFCLLTILKYEKKYTLKIMLLIFYFIVFGLMSGSRTFLLVLVILAFIYMFEVMINFNQNKKMVFITIITIIVMIFFVINYMEDTLNMIYKRFLNEDISGERFQIYKQYFDATKSSPYIIFGSGMQDYHYKYNIELSSHNFFIEVISIWGIVGLMIVFLWFALLYKSLNISKKLSIHSKSVLHYLPLLGLFLYGQTGQFFISYYHTLPTLILAFLNIKYVDTRLVKNSKHADCL